MRFGFDPALTSKLRGLSLLVFGGGAAACYSAEFDELASELYSCEEDSECADDYSCFDGLCVEDAGPKLQFLGPEDRQPFEVGSSVFPVSFRATELLLVEPGGADPGGDSYPGYVEVYLDGEPLDVNPITTGNITAGIGLDADAGVVLRGGHRLEAKVFRPDGTPYDNPSARARRIFFVENGLHDVPNGPTDADLPLAVITSPWPGDTVPLDEDLEIEVSTLYWTWVDASINEPAVQGHSHVYVGLPDYPDCQPGCNLLYRDTIQPNTSVMVDTQTYRSAIGLQEQDGADGEVTVSVSLHKSDHSVYPEPPLADDDEVTRLEKLQRIPADTVRLFVE